MNSYTAYEYDENCEPTGRKLTFASETLEGAIESCLYTLKLKDGNAKVGPTGQVIYSGKFRYAIPKHKETV